MEKVRSFFRKRKESKELLHKQMMEQFDVLIGEIQVEKNMLTTLSKDVKQNGTDISRHDMALEDCLDMLEEWGKERVYEQKQRQSLEQEREKLLQMLGTYQEQLWNMKTYAEKNDSAWHQQLLLVEKVVQEKMVFSGITAIDRTDCVVNYELHEVIELIDTEDMNRDRTVAVIYKPGYLYRGEVRKKAQVAVYHLQQ